MFFNQKFCTVYEKNIDKETRTEAYLRHIFQNVYWQETTGQTTDGKSRNPENTVLCMIPADSLQEYFPKRDDLLVCGLCEDEIPKSDYFTIKSVKNFLYGSEEVQHIEVTAT